MSSPSLALLGRRLANCDDPEKAIVDVHDPAPCDSLRVDVQPHKPAGSMCQCLSCEAE